MRRRWSRKSRTGFCIQKLVCGIVSVYLPPASLGAKRLCSSVTDPAHPQKRSRGLYVRESILSDGSRNLALILPRMTEGGAIMTISRSDVTVENVVQAVVAGHRGQRGSPLPILHAIQAELGYVPPEAIPVLPPELN